ncbi:MAG: Protein YgiW [Steroidobacteraceae bacterium]|nr:Protein YgiW [Steroidobacteraceae bacterium]
MRAFLIGTGLALAATVALGADTAGGFKGPDNLQVSTAAAAAGLSDDTPVKLQGHIVKALGGERYEFRDETGTIVVEIDNKVWRGLEVTPETKIELRGEVDKEWNKVEVEADSVQLVQ